MQYYRRRGDSIFDNFTLNPLPYPVLLILAVIAIFLGGSWYFSYEELVESTESSMGLGLFVLPVLLIFLVRWMSSPWDRRRRTHYQAPAEGSSPWGVAALIVLLLVLLQFQSAFLDSWF
ncbi:unnamed protein product [Linum tenue]|uniref:Uncharacterized protein n=1 Tax=Linum tenue TaxID=586396 RepID=A0AAV0LXT8_9ROSI|nr:unnamed protein product [Linum tenue]